jgi:formylglycine-generating enzyme required for sulfatase activity
MRRLLPGILAIVWLAPAPARADDEPVLSADLWRPACSAHLIVLGRLDVPAAELREAIETGRHKYCTIRVQVAEVLKGAAGSDPLGFEFYTQPSPISPAPDIVLKADKQEAVLFLARAGPEGKWYLVHGEKALLPGSPENVEAVRKECEAQKRILADPDRFLRVEEDETFLRVKRLIEETQDAEKAPSAPDRIVELGAKAVPALIRLMDDRRDLLCKGVSFKAPEGHWEGISHYSPKKVVDLCDAVLNHLEGFGGTVTNGGTEFQRAMAVASWRVYLFRIRHKPPDPPAEDRELPARPALPDKFLQPDGDKDRHGNPVVTREGRKSDPASGLAFEIWMKEPRIEFVLVPAGEFAMGADETEKSADSSERPSHKVRITRPFYMAKYEITQGQWQEVMKGNPAHFKDSGTDAPVESGNDWRAFTKVSWKAAGEFCRRLGLSLPTEAQWEYACRAGGRGTGADLAKVAWFADNSGGRTHPVGKLEPNGFGLYDMLGNVWEWCEDVYDEGFYKKPEASGDDPVCRSGSDRTIFRGAGFGDYKYLFRPSMRGGAPRGYQSCNIGLRPVWKPAR